MSSEHSELLKELLGKTCRRSLDRDFEHLLDSQVNISKGMHFEASTSQQHLRDFLNKEKTRDQTFPRVLSIQDRDFLGGSFARHTKIWPLDDIDIYFPLDGQNLCYYQSGIAAPYKILSDGIRTHNPLLTFRWMEGEYISSRKLVNEFAKVLERHYSEATKIKSDNQAVNIQMKKGETKDESGLGFDVVPCFCLQPHDTGKSYSYLIPNGFGGWTHTNPRIDTAIAKNLQDKNNKTYRKVVKLIKYWNKEIARDMISSSYYIELAISRVYLAENRKGNSINKISQGLALGFKGLYSAICGGSQAPLVREAPYVSPGNINDVQKKWLDAVKEVTTLSWSLEREKKENEAIKLWRKIFGENLKGD